MNPILRVGVFDWCRFPGQGDFYPPDLPKDWRLDYYSNEFDSACLAVECFRESADLLMESVEDLRTDFELAFSLRSASDVSLLADLAPEMDCPVRYLLADLSDSDILLQIEASEPLSYSSNFNTAGQVVDFSGLWRPESGASGASTIALLPGAATVRQYRDWIEQWLAGDPPGQQLTLWLDGRTTDYQALQGCRSVVELMGF